MSSAKLPPYFCYRVMWENRRNACAFQGFHTPHGFNADKARCASYLSIASKIRGGAEVSYAY